MWSTAVLKHLRTEAFRYSSTEAHVLNGYFRILPQSISYNKHLDIKKKNPNKTEQMNSSEKLCLPSTLIFFLVHLNNHLIFA